MATPRQLELRGMSAAERIIDSMTQELASWAEEQPNRLPDLQVESYKYDCLETITVRFVTDEGYGLLCRRTQKSFTNYMFNRQLMPTHPHWEVWATHPTSESAWFSQFKEVAEGLEKLYQMRAKRNTF